MTDPEAVPPNLLSPDPSPTVRNFGLDQAIELMKTLPNRDPELVMHAVGRTLEAMGVSLDSLIDSADKSLAALDVQIVALDEAVTAITKELEMKRTALETARARRLQISRVLRGLALACSAELLDAPGLIEQITDELRARAPLSPIATAGNE